MRRLNGTLTQPTAYRAGARSRSRTCNPEMPHHGVSPQNSLLRPATIFNEVTFAIAPGATLYMAPPAPHTRPAGKVFWRLFFIADFDPAQSSSTLATTVKSGIRAVLGLRHVPHLPDGAADHHRHAHGFGFIDAEFDVLVGKARGEGVIEFARSGSAAGNMSIVAVLRPLETLMISSSSVAGSSPALVPIAMISTVSGHRGHGEQVVAELRRLREAGRLADKEHLAEHFQHRVQRRREVCRGPDTMTPSVPAAAPRRRR